LNSAVHEERSFQPVIDDVSPQRRKGREVTSYCLRLVLTGMMLAVYKLRRYNRADVLSLTVAEG
jgi:hypothetical protein